MKLYHNPRCQKSRQALTLLKDNDHDPELIMYMQDGLNKEDISGLIYTLDLDAIDLVRTTEKVWKEEYKDKDLSQDDIIDAIHREPKLLQRPILIHGDKGVIGRPPERVLDIL